MPEICNFIKKETLAQVFSCEFCEISKNTFFTEHLWTTASIECSDLTWRSDYWSVGFRYRVVWKLFYLSLYTIVSKNGVICDEILYLNLIVLCFLFSSLINVINCSFVPFYMINMSSIYLKYKRVISLIYGYICFSSNCVISRLA